MKLRTKLLQITAVSLLLSLAFLMGMIYLKLDEVTQKIISEETSTSINYEYAIVDTYVSDVQLKLEKLSADPLIVSALETRDPNSAALASDLLYASSASSSLVATTGLHDANCVSVASSSLYSSSSSVGRDFSDRDYCQGVLRTKLPYISGSFISTVDNTPTFAVSVPVKSSSGEFIGYVVSSIDTRSIHAVLEPVAKSHRVLLYDRYGQKFVDSGTPLSDFANSNEDFSDDLRSELGAGRILGVFQNSTDLFAFKDFGYVTVAVVKPKQEAYWLINDLAYSIVVFFAISFVLALYLVWRLSGSISSAIEDLSGSVTEITKGNLSVRLKYCSIEEVQDLTLSLERVLASLKLAILRNGLRKSDVGIGELISERHDLETRFSLLRDNVNELVLLIDVKKQSVFEANKFLEALTGYTKEDLPLGVEKLFSKFFNSTEFKKIEDLSKQKKAFVFDLQRKDSGSVLVSMLTSDIVSLEGKKVVLCVIRDISELSSVQNLRMQELSLHQSVIDALPLPVFFKDANGIYSGCNNAFEKYIGKTRGEIVGHTVYDIAPPDLAKIYHEADLDLMKKRATQVYQTKVRAADGKERDVVFHKAPIFDKSGRVTGLVGAIMDVSGDYGKSRRSKKTRSS